MLKPVAKILPVAAALMAIAVAACNPEGERATVTGSEMADEFSAQNVSTTPKSYEPELPPVDMPGMTSVSASTIAP
jgi:hypothetical protein